MKRIDTNRKKTLSIQGEAGCSRDSRRERRRSRSPAEEDSRLAEGDSRPAEAPKDIKLKK